MNHTAIKLLQTGPVLLLGTGGMLHRAWAELLEDERIGFRAVGRAQLDLSRAADVSAALGRGPALVINCAAYTNVDLAETEEAQATEVNGAAVGRLAKHCADTGGFLVHYSTDYVFSGNPGRPWRINDPIAPVNAYGRSKAQGERLIRESRCAGLIVRTSWLYAPWGKNFIRTIAAKLREGNPLRVVDDQRGRPTSSERLAWNTLKLLRTGATGLFHLSDGGDCTWYGLAVEIARHVAPGARIEPCKTADFPRPARRPEYSVLDLSASEALIGPIGDWRETLADVCPRLEP